MGDFNPAFSFNIKDAGAEAQAPWEFGGALKHAQPAFGTSIDTKIKQRLEGRSREEARRLQRGGRAKQLKAPVPPASRRAPTAAVPRHRPVPAGGSGHVSDNSEDGSSAGEDEDSDFDDGSDSEDAPLPGEQDSGSDEESDGLAGDESQEEDEEDTAPEESSDEEERAPAAKRSRPAAAATPAVTAVSAVAPMDVELPSEDDDDAAEDARKAAPPRNGRTRRQRDGSSDEDTDEEEGPRAAAAAKRRRTATAAAARNGLFTAAPEGTSFAAQSFADLNLSRPLVRACAALGYPRPTPIQAACVPLALTGRDICGSAVTGSGKTAAFALPLLERLLHRSRRVAATYALVLAPTRELAVQVHSMIQKLAQFTDVQAALAVGGLSLQAQAAALRAAPEIVVATPGRLIDHLRNSQGFGLEDLAALVLDEADRLLEMGFAEEVREIVRLAPVRRQTMLFSATMTEEVRSLAALSLRHPVRLAADAVAAAPGTLAQEVIRLKGGAAAQKEAVLLALAGRSLAASGRTIVFFKTKQRAHRAKIVFGLAGLPAAAELHGDMTQSARLESLERFRKGEVAFLLATDVAARGLDILGVETVVNFDCPPKLSSYLHRVGRTARAGERGRSITFVEDSERGLLKEVVKGGGAVLTQRAVPAAAVATWQTRLDALDADVRRIYGEEAEEKALRKAEMEAQKASNMLDHEAEIYSRPARSWFQTPKEKKEAATRAKAAETGPGIDGAEGEGSRGAKKGQDKAVRRQERKAAAAQEAASAGNKSKRPNALMQETAGITGRVRAAKAREHALRSEGMPGAHAGRAAAAQVSGVKKKKKATSSGGAKAKAAAGDGESGGGGSGPPAAATSAAAAHITSSRPGAGLFSGDGVSRAGPPGSVAALAAPGGKGAKVYAGGARSGAPKAPPVPGALTGSALNRKKRGDKGKHAFKSKSRHKRR